MLDPRERCTVANCLEHASFETERLLHRNSMSAVGRRGRKQSATRVVDAVGHDMSRPASVIRSKTPSNVVTEVRFTPLPPDKMELGSVSPDHLQDVLDQRCVTPAAHWQESGRQTSQGGAMRSSPNGATHGSVCELNTHACTELSQGDSVPDVTTSRFVRKKSVTSSKPAEDDISLDQRAPSVLPAVEDTSQKERGTFVTSAAAAAAKKTYCVNVSGTTVPPQRTKKNPPQISHVNTVAVKGSPLAERKAKVCRHISIAPPGA